MSHIDSCLDIKSRVGDTQPNQMTFNDLLEKNRDEFQQSDRIDTDELQHRTFLLFFASNSGEAKAQPENMAANNAREKLHSGSSICRKLVDYNLSSFACVEMS